jgi:hypothetical protein
MAKTKPNFEKIGTYISSLVLLAMLWQMWMNIYKEMSNIKERTAKSEEKISALEKKTNHQ